MLNFVGPRRGKSRRLEMVEQLEVRRMLSAYTGSVLYTLPSDAYSFKQAYGGQVVGFAYDLTTFSPTDAALWPASGNVVDLNSASDSEAEAWATDGSQQVGWGGSSTVEDAMLWSGSSATAVNLNPSGFSDSIATDISGSQEVGYGTNPSNSDNALLWTGSASSVVNLNPSGFASSAVNATDGSQQVGFGTLDADTHLLLWSGTASSFVELDPAGYFNGSLLGLAPGQQVGDAFNSTAKGAEPHALLWTGSAGSFVDLNPAGMTGSTAYDTNGVTQVGVGINGSSTVAYMWSGTAGSAVNLNSLLPASGGWFFSQAYTIDKSGNIYGIATGTNGTFAVEWSPPPPAKLAFSPQPAGMTAGVALAPFSVDVEDASGALSTFDSSTITLSIEKGPTGGSIISGGSAAANAGVATFSSTVFDVAGQYTLTASDTGDGLPSTNSNPFTITAAAGSKLVFSPEPTGGTAGTALSGVTVDVEDKFNNITSDTSTVVITLNSEPSGATLTGTTSVAAKSGVASFTTLILDTAGTNYSFKATDGSLASTTSSTFTVTAGAATQLVLNKGTSDVAAGAAMNPAVIIDVEDKFGNIATGNTSTVTFSIITGPSGSKISGTPAVAANAGVATFSNLVFDTVGTGYVIKASDGSLTSVTPASFNVTPGSASKLVYMQQPVTTTAGVAIAPAITVDIEDAFGNLVTSNTSTVTVAVATGPSGAKVSGSASAAASGGQAMLSGVILDTAGTNYSLKATDGSLTSATSTTFAVNPGTAAKLAFAATIGTAGAGSAITPAVKVNVEDTFGNIVTGNGSTVDIALATSPSGATLTGTQSATAQSGVATFSNLILSTLGSNYSFTVTDGSLLSATSNTFTVSAGPAAQLVIVTGPPSTEVAGTALSPAPVFDIEDAQGNIVTSSTASVTMVIASSSNGGSISGTPSVNAKSGVVMFGNLIFNTTGSYTLKATLGSISSAATSSFTITPAPANASIAGTVTAGGTGVANVTVYLDNNNDGSLDNGERSTVTSSSGVYSFTGLTAGAYIVRQILPSGDTQTTPTNNYGIHVTLSTSQASSGNNFVDTVASTGGSISGAITAGGSGVANVTVYLDTNNDGSLDNGELSTVTSSSGAYSFTGLAAGGYIVRQILPSGDTQTSPTNNYGIHITLASGQSSGGNNFVDTVPVSGGSISGAIDVGSSGLAGVTVYLDANNNGKLDTGEVSTVTGSSGTYSFSGLAAGTYIVRQILPSGVQQVTPTNNYGNHETISSNQSLTGVNFSDKQIAGSISGEIFDDANGNGKLDSGETGLSDWELYIDLNNSGAFVSGDPTTMTDSNGDYTFGDLAAGTYIIRVMRLSGWSQTLPTSNFGQHITIGTGQNVTGVLFGMDE